MWIRVSWPWVTVAGVIGTLFGLLLCRLFPSPWRKPPKYRFNPLFGLIIGVAGTSVAAYASSGDIVTTFFSAIVVTYVSAMVPMIRPDLEQEPEDQKVRESPLNRVLFRQDWDARPRYENETEGLFVGRRELLDRLTSDFVSKRSGTILISGVRGVGKTALIDRALLEARNRLQNRYWKRAKVALDNARILQPVESQIRQVLFELSTDVGGANESNDYLGLKKAATNYSNHRSRFARWFALTDLQIRRMDEASRSQLFVLKFNASDIGGAMTDAGANGNSGKPHINPEKLLKALIRKLYNTCHPSKKTSESRILDWSLTDKKERTDFFGRLAHAYTKSTSKYKETVSDVVSEDTKRSRSLTIESAFKWTEIVIVLACVAIGIYAGWQGWIGAWRPLQTAIFTGVPGAVALYFSVMMVVKASWQRDSNHARQAQLSYERDYSLAQMEDDLERIVSALHVKPDAPFNRNRCFSRTIIIFDELDKLEDPIAQLNDVITHFKNFFTLSDALFVFITDQEFYEHLCWEAAKALQDRHYSPEHTFFTQKIYLRKPEFSHFQETIYRFCEPAGLDDRVMSGELDSDLTEYLAQQKPTFFDALTKLPLKTLTHLYIHRQRYAENQKF